MAAAARVVTDLTSTITVSTPDRSLASVALMTDSAVEVLLRAGVIPEMAAQLALVIDAARPGGLSSVSSDQALCVVEAVEAVKAWADSISLEATAVMVTELETDFTYLAPEGFSCRGWQRFFRQCRSATARETQVATGLQITQCQRRVWLTVCEPERVGSTMDQMRLGRVTLARAMT